MPTYRAQETRTSRLKHGSKIDADCGVCATNFGTLAGHSIALPTETLWSSKALTMRCDEFANFGNDEQSQRLSTTNAAHSESALHDIKAHETSALINRG